MSTPDSSVALPPIPDEADERSVSAWRRVMIGDRAITVNVRCWWPEIAAPWQVTSEVRKAANQAADEAFRRVLAGRSVTTTEETQP